MQAGNGSSAKETPLKLFQLKDYHNWIIDYAYSVELFYSCLVILKAINYEFVSKRLIATFNIELNFCTNSIRINKFQYWIMRNVFFSYTKRFVLFIFLQISYQILIWIKNISVVFFFLFPIFYQYLFKSFQWLHNE